MFIISEIKTNFIVFISDLLDIKSLNNQIHQYKADLVTFTQPTVKPLKHPATISSECSS